MKSINVCYRIPIGIHDIFKRQQKGKKKQEQVDIHNADLIIKLNTIARPLKQQITITIMDLLKSIINNTAINMKEDELDKFVSILEEDLEVLEIKYLEVGSNFFRCKIDEELCHIKLHYDQKDIILDIERDNPQPSGHVARIIEKLDKTFLEMEKRRLVYKYITEKEKTLAFSNKGGKWKEPMHVFLGLDVGSVSTNLAVVDEKQNVLESVYTYTRGRVLDAIKTAFKEIKTKLPENAKVLGVGVTGSSGELAKKILNADVYKTEIYSHAAATIHQIPEVRTILEIGGQDSKVIYVNNKIPEKSKMNEWCGAGTGAMLDAQAYRLGIDIKDFGDYALKAKKSIDFRTRCGVFMDSCMIDAQAKGYPVEVIVAGLCKACAHNFIGTLGINRKTLETPVAFQGGVAANKGVKKELEEYISQAKGEKIELIVPVCHDVMGAIGMALIVQKAYEKRQEPTTFRGFDDLFKINAELAECNYDKCPQNKKEDETCDIFLLKINNETIAAVGACEEYEAVLSQSPGSGKKAADYE
ncbi:MAG: hypothetical protein JW925_00470 [Syntrophaceae bacterium]|nr:hypothetical protein [Syntrophaceae bacterium]